MPQQTSVRFFNHLTKFLLLLVPALSSFAAGHQAPTWESLNSTIDAKFPKVNHMSTQTLRTLQGKEEFLLIDVRPKKEYRVSHIPGAMNIDDPDDISADKNAKIILYCSVGYRSAKFAETLNKRGYNNTWNLRGSIFEWANRGYPLTDGERSVNHVHPYDKKWGVLLQPKLHRYSRETK